MSKKSMDIDALIGKDQLEITLGGKTYIVEDVPMSLFLEVSTDEEKDPQALHRQLARLFGVDISELQNVGLRAAALSLREVRNWLFESSGIPQEGVAESGSTNP
jgi:hypothetical protein